MKNTLPTILSAKVFTKGAGYDKNLLLTLDNGETVTVNGHVSSLIKARTKAKDAVGKTLGFYASFYGEEMTVYYDIGSSLTREEAIEKSYKEEMEIMEAKMKKLADSRSEALKDNYVQK
jgi:hypothetical protein